MDNNIKRCFMPGMSQLNAPVGQKAADVQKPDVFTMPAAGDRLDLGSGFGVTPQESAGRVQIAAALNNLDMSKLNPELVLTLSSGNIPMNRDSISQSVKVEFGSLVSDSTAGKIADLAMSKLLADKSGNPSA